MTHIANTDQYVAWNGDSGQRWIADADRRDRVMTPIADALLDTARLAPGDRVLDIGCGCGATTVAAARSVAPTGDVHGVDLSAPMLDVARRWAEAAGLINVYVEQADAQTHRLPRGAFDVAISRFGTMFFADPGAAFANLAPALRPGGRLRMATWQPLDANGWLAVPGAALLQYGSLPETTGPGMFSQSDPSDITATLGAGRFTTVEVTPIAVVLNLGADPGDAADYLAGTGVGRAVLDTVPEADKPVALDAVRSALAEHQTARGVELGAAILDHVRYPARLTRPGRSRAPSTSMASGSMQCSCGRIRPSRWDHPRERRQRGGSAVLQTSDRAAFQQLARDELTGLYALARRLTGRDTEDLVQEALLRACRSFSSLRDRQAGGQWLRVILTNVWRDQLRKNGREPTEVSLDDVEGFSLYRTLVEEDPFPYSDTLHLDFLGSFSEDDVHTVLQRLPPLYRAPLVLRYMEGFPTKQIARVLELPLGTVLSQLHRGRKLFERGLWDYAVESGALVGPACTGEDA